MFRWWRDLGMILFWLALLGSGPAWAGPDLDRAGEVVNCDYCHTGQELSDPGLLRLEPGSLSEMVYQPCPGLKQLFEEKYLLESRVANLALLSSRSGQGRGGAGSPGSKLDDAVHEYQGALAASSPEARVFIETTRELRLRLDREVYRPLLHGWRLRRLWIGGGGALVAALVLLALVWFRYLPWRRRRRGQESLWNRETGAPGFLTIPRASIPDQGPRNRA